MQYELIMGNRVYSGWSLRAWLTLKRLDIEFAHRVVPLYTEAFEDFRRDLFPARQLPTLVVTDGASRHIVWDSLAILEFLSDRYPTAGLWPDDWRARAAARSLCAEIHSGFKALRANLPFNLRRRYTTFVPDTETAADIERVRALWKWTGATFPSDGPYLFGPRYTAADAFFTPFAARFHTYGIELDPPSQAYANALLQRPDAVAFRDAARNEPWVMAHNEFDLA